MSNKNLSLSTNSECSTLMNSHQKLNQGGRGLDGLT